LRSPLPLFTQGRSEAINCASPFPQEIEVGGLSAGLETSRSAICSAECARGGIAPSQRAAAGAPFTFAV